MGIGGRDPNYETAYRRTDKSLGCVERKTYEGSYKVGNHGPRETNGPLIIMPPYGCC